MSIQNNEQQSFFIEPNKLKAISKQKAVMLGLLIGIFIPIIIFEALEFPHSLHYLKNIALAVISVAPLTALVTFFSLKKKYECPKCKSAWLYQKINEIITESFITQQTQTDDKDLENIRVESYLNEYECANCGYKHIKPKKRKIKE